MHVVPHTARYILCTDSPPPLTDAVLLANHIRDALMARSDGAPVFSGRSRSGERLQGHIHAHILPESWNQDGTITHITVHAAMGFDPAAQAVLQELRLLSVAWGPPLRLACLGIGEPRDFAGFNTLAGHSPLLVASRIWESRTPFVNTRHEKSKRTSDSGRGAPVGSAEHDLRRLLEQQGYPQLVSVEPIAKPGFPCAAPAWERFQVQRPTGRGMRGTGSAGGFRVVFGEVVQGPVAVGYNAHFGLGGFGGSAEGAGGLG